MTKDIKDAIRKELSLLPKINDRNTSWGSKSIKRTIVFKDKDGNACKKVIKFITQGVVEFEMPFHNKVFVPRWFLSYESLKELEEL